MRLTLRVALEFEQARMKSFYAIDLEDEKDVLALSWLLYRSSSEERAGTTYELFTEALVNEQVVNSLICEVRQALDRAGAPSLGDEIKQTEVPNEEAQEEARPNTTTLGSIVCKLILSGVDAGYLMDQCELWEVRGLIDALEEKRREDLEEKRLFTWLAMLPHLSKDSAKTAQELFPFPWEVAEEQEERDYATRLLWEMTTPKDSKDDTKEDTDNG